MTVVETSISINQPVEKVFAHITDIQKQKDGNPSITAIEMDGKVAVGTRYKVKMSLSGREFIIENEIVALEKNKTLGIKTLAAPPAAPVTNTYTLEKEGSGTKLGLAMDAVVMPGTENMVVPSLRASLDTALAAIKKALG
jgi:carbon monoxide dehydrogenase subunit G